MLPLAGWRVDRVFAGKIQRYDNWYKGASSAIDKKECKGAVTVGKLGITEDQQSRKSHGGPERALLQYAGENYDYISKVFEKKKRDGLETSFDFDRLRSPGFGENIATSCGMTEDTVCIGDVYKLGTATIQVSMPRAPCFHLNHRFQARDRAHLLSILVETQQKAGWLYRVLEAGKFKAGDEFVLVERPLPNMSVKFAHRMVSETKFPLDAVKEMKDCALLAEKWRKYARERIANGNHPVGMSARLLGGSKGAHLKKGHFFSAGGCWYSVSLAIAVAAFVLVVFVDA
uniref:MOSC domain-containing protein n=1 Tax=Lotharella globosa TaxID=91324 RepID=A0A7S3ZF37_9EUKA